MQQTDNSLRLDWPRTAGATAAPAPRAVRASARWLRRGGIAIGAVVGLVGLLALSGTAYEAIAEAGDAALYPPAGRLVDVGGYRLHLDCRGTGTPTVVMDAGLGGSSRDWTLVQSELATTTQVCSYDRAGMGWSDTGPNPRTPAHIAEELHTLLRSAGLPAPYVLVGHSLAGKTIRMFAAEHAGEVAGMVLVDARSERIDAATSPADTAAFGAALESQALTYTVARRLGLARLLGASLVGEPLLSPAVATELALLETLPAAIAATTAEGLARSADDPALAHATLGTMPLVVIAAKASMTGIPGWPDAQEALAALSSRGRLVVAEHSGHPVQLEQPGLVIDAVREVLAEIRGGPGAAMQQQH